VSTARRAGALLAAALVAAFLVWGVAGGWSKAASYPWKVNWSHLVLAVVVLALFDLGWGMGYTRLIETLGHQRVERQRVMSIWARSLLGRYVPGNVVMFAGRVVLGREAGISGQVSVAASAYEQVAMLVPAAVGATVFLLVANRSGWSPWYWIVVAVPFGVVVLDPVVLERGAERLLKRFGRASTLIPLTVGLAFLLSWVVAMVAFIFPSGLGVREGVFAVLLARHIPAAAAVSVAAASRLLLTAVELVVVASVVAAGRARR
jgi:hypothetical protein